MPNEIFEDLKQHINIGKHVAFAYTYYYFISYLYRYCKWYIDKPMTQSDIKSKLGLSSVEKRVDYLIKKNGVLDKMNYTLTTGDYPVEWTTENDILEFTMISELRERHSIQTIITERALKVKCPIRCFSRSGDIDSNLLDGTFYDVSNTHDIRYDKFEHCMNNEKLGYMGFYIYSYIKHKNDIYGAYTIEARRTEDKLGVSYGTFKKYTDELEACGLMKIRREKFVGEGGKANKYKAK